MKFVWLLIAGALMLCTGCASQSQIYLSTERAESTEDILEVQLETESENVKWLCNVVICSILQT